MTLYLHDTLSRRKRAFTPRDPNRVTLYVCGPTVYDYAHIGNARPPVVFDVLVRLLRRTYGTGAVLYARNVTDVDDKINAKAAREGVPIGEVTARYEAAYLADMAQLNVAPPDLALRPGDATLLFYMTEEAQEGRDAYAQRRSPDFTKFPRRP